MQKKKEQSEEEGGWVEGYYRMNRACMFSRSLHTLSLYSFVLLNSPTRIKACAVTNDQEDASVDGNVNQQNSMIINTIVLLKIVNKTANYFTSYSFLPYYCLG